ncbi:hypothetical protein LTR17_001622 [Elasticomyces elasticus]|nr:hypothetical protein LTR17_001622 [Elasticomyces elasticus]
MFTRREQYLALQLVSVQQPTRITPTVTSLPHLLRFSYMNDINQKTEAITGSMASSPLTNTPTDIMFDIFDLLTVTDLCNFRLVCRWGKNQAFKSFASRGYKDLQAYNCRDSACDLANILSRNKELATFVKTFTVHQCQFCINQDRGCRNDSNQPCEQDGAWTMSDIISALPNLNKIVLGRMANKSLARHLHRGDARDVEVPSHTAGGAEAPIHPAFGTSLPHLATVSLLTCFFTTVELKTILCLAGAPITHFDLTAVDCTDGNWLGVLSFILDIAGDSSSLWLVDPKAGVYYFELMPENGAKFFKALRGEHGIEAVTVQKGVASMKGKQAIKLGVAVITQYVTDGLWR